MHPIAHLAKRETMLSSRHRGGQKRESVSVFEQLRYNDPHRQTSNDIFNGMLSEMFQTQNLQLLNRRPRTQKDAAISTHISMQSLVCVGGELLDAYIYECNSFSISAFSFVVQERDRQ